MEHDPEHHGLPYSVAHTPQEVHASRTGAFEEWLLSLVPEREEMTMKWVA